MAPVIAGLFSLTRAGDQSRWIATITESIRAFDSAVAWLLDAGLAKWKLPEEIVVWDAPLPRTTSGKIQRRLLGTPAPEARHLLAPRLRTAPVRRDEVS